VGASQGRDALLLNPRGEITEATIASVAVEIGGRLWTPPVRCGLLPGVYRRLMLDRGELLERAFTLQDLQNASALYLMNSVRGMWRVRLAGR
jgi:para-aminobenzoate synthetase/4-amino-4-deoxychorismate lyase